MPVLPRSKWSQPTSPLLWTPAVPGNLRAFTGKSALSLWHKCVCVAADGLRRRRRIVCVLASEREIAGETARGERRGRGKTAPTFCCRGNREEGYKREAARALSHQWKSSLLLSLHGFRTTPRPDCHAGCGRSNQSRPIHGGLCEIPREVSSELLFLTFLCSTIINSKEPRAQRVHPERLQGVR